MPHALHTTATYQRQLLRARARPTICDVRCADWSAAHATAAPAAPVHAPPAPAPSRASPLLLACHDTGRGVPAAADHRVGRATCACHSLLTCNSPGVAACASCGSCVRACARLAAARGCRKQRRAAACGVCAESGRPGTHAAGCSGRWALCGAAVGGAGRSRPPPRPPVQISLY